MTYIGKAEKKTYKGNYSRSTYPCIFSFILIIVI